jgi:CRISPR-associated protein Csd2
MVVRGVFDFEHVGTQGEGNAAQNRREAKLGCAHAHELFESIGVKLTDESRPPLSFRDYEVTIDGWDDRGVSPRFPGVVLHRRVEPNRGRPS